MDASFSAADAAPTPIQPPAAASATDSSDPLLWAILLVWLSVEAIGDGLRALISVLAAAAASPTATPS